jgi:hypothetical protein
MQPLSAPRVFALCAAILSLAVLPTTARATSTQAEVDAAIVKAVDYVRSQQDPVTGEPFGFEHGSFSSDWVATSLAAAGVSSADMRATPASPSLQDFLLGDYSSGFWSGPPLGAATDYERVTLVAHAAGLDPARISADTNLPAQIAGRWNPAAGSFGEPSINSTVFGILALRTTPAPAWALSPAVSFLRLRQHDDGGWTFSAAADPASKAEPSEPDMTGAAIAALCEAGAPAYDPAIAAALAYLKGLLVDATGAFHYAFGDNADATAWAVSGLNACGIDPQSSEWRTAAGKTPIDHLLSLQVQSGPEAGGFGYESSGEAPNLYSTQDALRAIAGGAFTATPPPRSDPSQPRVRPAPAVAAGVAVPHLLAIGLAPGNVRICKVSAPNGTTLAELLAAAEADAAPAGCVASFSLEEGEVASIDGVAPDGEDEAWLARLDRGPAAVAATQPVRFGDAVSLWIGARPASGGVAGGPAGPAGLQGAGGDRGPRGRRGARGRRGRNARFRCRVRRRCAAKRRHSNTLPGPRRLRWRPTRD